MPNDRLAQDLALVSGALDREARGTSMCEWCGEEASQGEQHADDCPVTALARVEAELARLSRRRDEEVDIPEHLVSASAEWLVVNQKGPDDVRWGRFPLGMVQRWVERAAAAEAELARLEREGLNDLTETARKLDAAEAEVERLTEGLREIVSTFETTDYCEALDLANIARALLAGYRLAVAELGALLAETGVDDALDRLLDALTRGASENQLLSGRDYDEVREQADFDALATVRDELQRLRFGVKKCSEEQS